MAATNEKSLKEPSPLQRELARRIVERMRDEGWGIGTRISEQGLAREFGVSRSPVRAALELLAAHDLFEPQKKRGLIVARDPAGLDPEVLGPGSPLEAVYEAMMRDCAEGNLPQEVSEAELMPRYGLSRGALRKLLMRFAAEGLAQRLPGHGWRFAETLREEAARNESYEFRIVVECASLRAAGFKVDPERFAQIRRAHERVLADRSATGGDEWFRINASFHEGLAYCSGNRFLLQAVRQQNSLRRMGEHAAFSELPFARIEQSCREHLAILDAIEAGDLDWAEAMLRRHLRLAAVYR